MSDKPKCRFCGATQVAAITAPLQTVVTVFACNSKDCTSWGDDKRRDHQTDECIRTERDALLQSVSAETNRLRLALSEFLRVGNQLANEVSDNQSLLRREGFDRAEKQAEAVLCDWADTVREFKDLFYETK